MRYPILAALLLLTGCGAGATPPPAVEIRTVTKTVEVAKPCPVTIPERPAPLPAVMPTDLAKFAATVLAKLVEYAGPGRYADKADAALRTCTKP